MLPCYDRCVPDIAEALGVKGDLDGEHMKRLQTCILAMDGVRRELRQNFGCEPGNYPILAGHALKIARRIQWHQPGVFNAMLIIAQKGESAREDP